MSFQPKRIYFEQKALDYPLGKNLYDFFRKQDVELKFTGSHNRVTGIPGKNPQQGFMEAKRTLVVGIRRTMEFYTCKPSAHYQLPLCTSCPGKCEYCYLYTSLAKKPYIRIYVNIEEILNKTRDYIEKRKPETTLFEGAATSDPVPVEKYTGSLKKTIEFFGQEKYGKFRFVTKFTDVDSLLDVEHREKTTFRFSLNTAHIIEKYEHNTPDASQRIEAAGKVAGAGYPIGFLIAPIIVYENWKKDYYDLLENLKETLQKKSKNISFELITHRYTARAKNRILEIFPQTTLPMNEVKRKFKYGQFGYGKYVYPKENMQEIEEFFNEHIEKLFPEAEIKYLV
ncbi:MAG: spore photoproduct lyase [Clostridiales bacterium]|nr:spore photoproduct lyase [Clostridiales bacterium]MCF8023533.1 spore photoproduct lyase [Clostridiales bacterium]